MWKKTSITLLLISALVFGSGFSFANTDSNQSNTHKVHYSTDWKNADFQELLDKILEQYKNVQKKEVTQQSEQQEANAPEKQTEAPAPQPNAEQQNAEEQRSEQTNESSSISEFEQQVVDLTNAERQKQGLAPLQIDKTLSKVARVKSQDMADNSYFSHQSPTYGSPFDMMQQFGVSYRAAGENIAKGQQSPEQVVNAWMNSEGHRANILNANFTHIGVGHVSNGNYWTQQFIGK